MARPGKRWRGEAGSSKYNNDNETDLTACVHLLLPTLTLIVLLISVRLFPPLSYFSNQLPFYARGQLLGHLFRIFFLFSYTFEHRIGNLVLAVLTQGKRAKERNGLAYQKFLKEKFKLDEVLNIRQFYGWKW
jgi:hypothetical protein